MWILMDTTQIKWDYVIIGYYKMRNHSIIAYLQNFLMNVKIIIIKNLTENNLYLFTHKTTNKIITPIFKQIFFITPEQNKNL